MENNSKQMSLNGRERIMRKIYLLLFFSIITALCCWIIYMATDNVTTSKKEFVMQMQRLNEFKNVQSQKKKDFIDTLSNAIDKYTADPNVFNKPLEDEIEKNLTATNETYLIYKGKANDRKNEDKLYLVFSQMSSLYRTYWYGRKSNFFKAKKNLEDKEEELKICSEGK